MKKILWLIIIIAGIHIAQRWIFEGEVTIWCFILLLLAFAMVCCEVLRWLQDRNILDRQLYVNLLTLLFASLFALLCAEFLLRQFAVNLRSSGEKSNEHQYSSPYNIWLHACDSCGGHMLYINACNSTELYKKPEFEYVHKYNGYGLRDRQFKLQKDSNEFRILGLGDSFTEGVGAEEDSTWLKQLEHMLNEHGGKIKYTTMNGGVHGSDLIFSYDLFTRCLMKYKPDLVILNLNSTDNGELTVRGDNQRFDAKGNFRAKKGPWWEFIFGSSFVVRLVVLNLLHYSWQLQSPVEWRWEEQNSINRISEKITDYYILAKKNNFSFLLILQPLMQDLPDGKEFMKRLNIDPGVRTIDLTGVYNNLINVQRQPASLYYWPVDGHFNARGYGVEAEVIYKNYFKDSLK